MSARRGVNEHTVAQAYMEHNSTIKQNEHQAVKRYRCIVNAMCGERGQSERLRTGLLIQSYDIPEKGTATETVKSSVMPGRCGSVVER